MSEESELTRLRNSIESKVDSPKQGPRERKDSPAQCASDYLVNEYHIAAQPYRGTHEHMLDAGAPDHALDLLRHFSKVEVKRSSPDGKIWVDWPEGERRNGSSPGEGEDQGS